MTGTPYSQQMLNAMEQAINQIKADQIAGASADVLEADVTTYYNIQASVRGYAIEAAEVSSDTNFNGYVANQNVEDYVNSVGGDWQSTRTSLTVNLALTDWNYITNNNYTIPTEYAVDQIHIAAFAQTGVSGTDQTSIPITYWSGTSFANDNLNWLGSYATPAELEEIDSQSGLFSGLSNSQVASSTGELMLAVAQAQASGITDSPLEAGGDILLALKLVNAYFANRNLTLINDLENLSINDTLQGNGNDQIDINDVQLAQDLYPSLPSVVPASFEGTISSSGALVDYYYNNQDGTSIVTTPDADGGFAVTSYTGQNGTGSVTKVDVENPDGTSQITTYDGTGNSITAHYSGPNGTGASAGVVYTLKDGDGDYVSIELSTNVFHFSATRLYDYPASSINFNMTYLGGVDGSASATPTNTGDAGFLVWLCVGVIHDRQ